MLSAFRQMKLVLPGMLLLLSACTHTPTLSQAERDAYLQQYIGQSSQTIPVALPLSVAQHPVAGTGTVPIPVTHSPSRGYDVNLQCKIVFELKDNIAQAVKYTGRTC